MGLGPSQIEKFALNTYFICKNGVCELIIKSTDYRTVGFTNITISPDILTITITKITANKIDTGYEIKIGDFSKFIVKNNGSIEMKPAGMSLTLVNQGENNSVVINSIIKYSEYIDIYQISMDTEKAKVSFGRSYSTVIDYSGVVPPKSLIKYDNNIILQKRIVNIINTTVLIPYIDILGQTLVDFTDIGNLTFTIGDQFKYYKDIPLLDNQCIIPMEINVDDLKLTVFNKCCPSMVSVLKGKGLTLLEKASDIYPGIPLDFGFYYKNIILYGMAKYIISRILYGKFNINYLLNKYNNKFLKDLGSSRFCSFLELFLDPISKIFGYNKYFKYSKHIK